MLKSFSKDFVLYGTGIAIVKLVNVFLLPIITAYFSPEEIGVIELGNSLISLLILVFLLNIDTALTFFYWDSKNDLNHQKEFTFTAFFLIIICIVIFAAVLFLCTPLIEKYYFRGSLNLDIKIIYLFGVLNALYTFFNKYQRIRKNIIIYNIFTVSYSILFIFSVYLLLKVKADINNYFYGKLISITPFVVFGMIYYLKNCKITFKTDNIKSILSYSLPLVPFSLASILLHMTDKYFLNLYYGIEDVGIYSVAYKLSSIISLFIAAYTLTYSPYAMSIKDKTDAKHTYKKLFQLYFAIGLFLIIVIQIFSKPILTLFVSDPTVYSKSLHYFCIIALGIFINSLYGQLAIGLNILKKTKYLAYGSYIALVVNIFLNFFLVREYGMLGVSISSLVAYLISCIWIYYINRKFYPIKYNKLLLVILTVVFILILIVYYRIVL